MSALRQVAAGALVALVFVIGANSGTSPAGSRHARPVFAAQKGLTVLGGEIAASVVRFFAEARAATGMTALPQARERN